MKMNLQFFGGRGSTGGNSLTSSSGESRVKAGDAYVERNGKYIDQIAELSKRPKEAISNFKENRSSITVTEKDGSKVKLTLEVDYGSDAGRKYASNNTENHTVFTQDSIYKDNKGSHYLVTKEYTIEGYRSNGNYRSDVSHKIKKISKLR